MALVPRIRFGNYGNGVYGLKTSPPGYDVTVLADDNDPVKRSLNSEWPSICKIKIIGAASSEWTQFQTQGAGQYIPNSPTYYSYSISGWQQVTPVQVPTGLPHIPVWEERVLDTVNDLFYDDFLYASTGPNNTNSYSGARSYHSGPTTAPANTIFFTPYSGVPNAASVSAQNNLIYNIDPGSGNNQFPGYPAYPAYPPKPTFRPTLVYVILNNKMGDVS